MSIYCIVIVVLMCSVFGVYCVIVVYCCRCILLSLCIVIVLPCYRCIYSVINHCIIINVVILTIQCE